MGGGVWVAAGAVIHPQGIRGVFAPSEINEILQLTERLAA